MNCEVKIVGIDCAVQPKKMGIAVGLLSSGSIKVESIQHGLSNPTQFIADAMQMSIPVLLALDAPLGWPAPMGEELADHYAADRVSVPPNMIFRRDTDRFVKKTIGKQSLDVGADRIARTAWSAVNLLAEVRRLTGSNIPLAWSSGMIHESSCIEVYPAATLEAQGLSSRGYKGNKPVHCESRKNLFAKLNVTLELADYLKRTAVSNDDAFDSLICLLAAVDFLEGKAMRPENIDTARKEGWIWVRSKRDDSST